jgi:hypothetical protein
MKHPILLLFGLSLASPCFAEASATMTRSDYILGGITGSFLGLGAGHAIQGRFFDKGWIFTIGEVTSFAFIIASSVDSTPCDPADPPHSGCMGGGWPNPYWVLVLGGLHIWEIIDVWAAPGWTVQGTQQNQQSATSPTTSPRLSLWLHPTRTGLNPVVGVGLRF